MAWTAPADALMLSFPAQFVAAVLALGTNVARPSAALMSAAAFNDECLLDWPAREGRNLSDAHLLSRCLPCGSVFETSDRAAALSARTVSELVQESDFAVCGDVLGAAD